MTPRLKLIHLQICLLYEDIRQLQSVELTPCDHEVMCPILGVDELMTTLSDTF